MGSTAPSVPSSGWRDAVDALTAFARPSASDGERRAAEWIAERLRALGFDARLEAEQAHGGYWWPLGLANLLAAGGAVLVLRRRTPARRALAAGASALAAAAIWDDVSGGRLWFRRALLPHRPTWNVVAQAGDPVAERTLILVAHHDAAHSGLVFHPGLARTGPRYFPRAHERARQSPPIMFLVWGGSVLTLAGALTGVTGLLKAGRLLALGTIAAMADIGARDVVPGANDNLSAVAVLLAVAERIRERPLEGLRVLLVSTGSEESFMEGMQGFGRRHFDSLSTDTTEVLCLECLGGPTLIVLEGEGMLKMRDYSPELRDALAAAAADAGIEVTRELRTVAATDGLVAMRAGYRTATLASIDFTKLPLNYHWPNDAPEALHWATIERAIEVCDRFLRSRARS